MRFKCLFIVAVCTLISCRGDQSGPSDRQRAFNTTQWQANVEDQYPYRDQMLDAVLYNDTLRTYSESEILNLLGSPDRRNGDYLYYVINKKKIGLMTLHEKNMVVKLDSTGVDWIKVHE